MQSKKRPEGFYCLFSTVLLLGFYYRCMDMSRTEEYLPWAELFVQTRRVVAVRMDAERGEYEALSENGSSYFIERLEQAQALLLVLQERAPDKTEPDTRIGYVL
ncbi:MAG: hypothetical protein KatS3mg072_1067 [Meiothermus sp.]|nr:MAG: hypothetical protein KatS3mg072_1067 [Meiothermus sp.]